MVWSKTISTGTRESAQDSERLLLLRRLLREQPQVLPEGRQPARGEARIALHQGLQGLVGRRGGLGAG
jgi:hypothetical protein